MLRPISAPKTDRFRRLLARLDLAVFFSLLSLITLFWLGGRAWAQGQSTSTPQSSQRKASQRKQESANRPNKQPSNPSAAKDAAKVEELRDRSFRLQVPPLFDAGIEASLEAGRVPTTPEESRAAAKRRWNEAEELRALGTAQSLRNAILKYEDALRLLRAAGKSGEPGEIAHTLNQIASIADALGDRQQAINYYNQSIPLWRAANDRQSEAATLTQLGRVYNASGDKQQAQHLFNQARLIVQASSLMRTVGEENRGAAMMFNLGKLYEEQGQPQQALQHYQQSLAMWRGANDKKGEASALNSLGSLAARAGQFDQAVQLFQQSLPLWRAPPHPPAPQRLPPQAQPLSQKARGRKSEAPGDSTQRPERRYRPRGRGP